MKRKDSKLVRMLGTDRFNLCATGMKVVRRRYGGKTLQQAWRSASTDHLITVLEAVGDVTPPVECGLCGKDSKCLKGMENMKAAEFRAYFKGIPASLRKLYAKA